MRQFIRHPTDMPIEVAAGAKRAARQTSRNVSYGGLSFCYEQPLSPGSLVHLRIGTVSPPFETDARVVWCSPAEQGNEPRDATPTGQYEIGVTFLQQHDAFCVRMVEQVCHIETYRKEVLNSEGRLLSAEDAAHEWIEKFAATFPDPPPAQ